MGELRESGKELLLIKKDMRGSWKEMMRDSMKRGNLEKSKSHHSQARVILKAILNEKKKKWS